MVERDSCATISRACGEPVLGTASRARRWLLLEQPGAWGADALHGSALPAPLARYLRRLSEQLPCRVLLLRRVGGHVSSATSRVLYAGVSRVGGGGWLEQFVLDHPDELAELELSPLAEGRSVGGEPVTAPLYLVCTNGKHDPCCAEHGLPVARTLAALLGERVWECSHVGGDRFAANVVCLPDGVFYGQLDPVAARTAVAAHEAGRVLLDHLRGRSPLSFAAQAAEVLVRRALAIDRLDGLRLLEHRRDQGLHRVTFRLPDGRRAIAVLAVRHDAAPARALTCATGPVSPPSFELLELELA